MNELQTEKWLARKSFSLLLHKKFGQFFLILLFLAVITLASGGFDGYIKSSELVQTDVLSIHTVDSTTVETAKPIPILPKQVGKNVLVKKVIDGDTIEYVESGNLHKVRMLGIDTPETVDPRKTVQCFGPEATAKSKELMQGKMVVLVADSRNQREKYGRELWYIYLTDGTFVNRYLIEEGFARATPTYKFDFHDDFVNLEKESRIANKGLWNKQICKI